MTTALADSYALVEIAQKTGITAAQARMVAAALGDLPAEQVVRLAGLASRDQQRQRERMARLGR